MWRTRPVPTLPTVSRTSTSSKRIRQRIRRWRLHRRSDLSFLGLYRMLNGHITGWVNYYAKYYKSALYQQLRRSPTWDRGTEPARHARLRIDTGLRIYFAEPPLAPAARYEREHERPPAPVLSQGHRSIPMECRQTPRRRGRTRRQAPQDARMEDPAEALNEQLLLIQQGSVAMTP
jgi:hypothetical protein